MEFDQSRRQAFLKAALPRARQMALEFKNEGPFPSAPKTVMGIQFPNPLGLAAGFDQEGKLPHLPQAMGLGFMEVGTLSKNVPLKRSKTNPVGINIGVPHSCHFSNAISHFIEMAEIYGHQADFLIINLSSPFIQSIRRKGGEAWAKELVAEVKKASDRPLCVKLRSDDIPEELPKLECNGLVIAHMSKDEDIISLYRSLKPYPVISVGGITSVKEIRNRLNHGADLVEIFTLLVTQGPRACLINCVSGHDVTSN